jgi:hypothetical protein
MLIDLLRSYLLLYLKYVIYESYIKYNLKEKSDIGIRKNRL